MISELDIDFNKSRQKMEADMMDRYGSVPCKAFIPSKYFPEIVKTMGSTGNGIHLLFEKMIIFECPPLHEQQIVFMLESGDTVIVNLITQKMFIIKKV